MQIKEKIAFDSKGKPIAKGNTIKYSRHGGKGSSIGNIHAIGKYALQVIDIVPEDNTGTITMRAVAATQVNRWELEDRI